MMKSERTPHPVRAALRCRRGATMVEYALLAALIALVASLSLTTMGTNIRARFTTIANTV